VILAALISKHSAHNNFNYIDNYDDVKIVLTEEQFNNLKHDSYKNLCCNELKECPICIQEFDLEDDSTIIKCNHIFHSNCIKIWLCEESNKCPICRVDIDKGHYL
jgi:hypothetical protein